MFLNEGKDGGFHSNTKATHVVNVNLIYPSSFINKSIDIQNKFK